MNITSHLNTKDKAVQGAPILGREKDMIQNHDKAYVFKIDPWKTLERFLVLGVQGGTYYSSEKKQTLEMVAETKYCVQNDPKRVADMILQYDLHRKSPALFLLASIVSQKGAGHPEAYFVMRNLARTSTDFFEFVEYVDKLRGWGRSLKRNVARWYLDKSPEQLSYQLIKYRQRNGWTHRDVLRLCHPNPNPIQYPGLAPLIKYAVTGCTDNVSNMITVFQTLQATTDVEEIVTLIGKHSWVAWEMISTTFLKEASVWEALLPTMPLMAMVRNLGRMSSLGMFEKFSKNTGIVVEKLNKEAVLKSKLHPLFLMNAYKVYDQGYGDKGSLSWVVNRKIQVALAEAFSMAFDNVPESDESILLALDVSGSMTNKISGLAISSMEACAVMAMVFMKKFKKAEIMFFSNTLMPLDLAPAMTFSEIFARINNLDWRATNCALPMVTALRNKWPIDKFVIMTDNETNAYDEMQPMTALNLYRKSCNKPDAKLVVVATEATDFSIADPADFKTLDICGFDAAAASLISTF